MLCLLFVTQILVAEDQYEYMVVSLGKNLFSKDYAKTFAYYDEMPASGHALLTELQLDILGKHSWEVIDILGAIGGDQQITLKRVYDEERTKKELKAIEENQTKAQSQKSQTPALEVPKKEKPTLVDLDAKDAEEKEAQRRAQIEQEITLKLKQVLDGKKVSNYEFSWKKESSISDNLPLPSVVANYSVTDTYLIGKNSYRKSQVEAFLEQEIDKVIPIADNLSERPDWIHLFAYITYENQGFLVGSKSISYSTYSKTWRMY